MKKPSSLETFRLFIKVINKYSIGIFIVIVSAGLMFIVLTYAKIASDAYDNPANSNYFDQETINKIRQLQPSSSNNNISIGKGRINPFSE